jgi:hypothetical protein
VLSQAELDLLVAAAIQRWADAGASEAQVAAMRATTVTVDDLAGAFVGLSDAGHIAIDTNAGGFNWFVDATPGDDSEYTGTGTQLNAAPHTQAGDRVDLLTTLMHELGHQIGLGDQYTDGAQAELMYGTIFIGQRRLPGADDAGQGTGAAVASSPLALTPINLGTIPIGKTVTIQWDSTVDTVGAGLMPSYSNFSTITGNNGAPFSVNSNTEVLGPTGSPTPTFVVLDSLSLGGIIWNDNGTGGGTAGNGILEGTEPGVNGVLLTLFTDNGASAGVWDLGDTQIATATTAGWRDLQLHRALPRATTSSGSTSTTSTPAATSRCSACRPRRLPRPNSQIPTTMSTTTTTAAAWRANRRTARRSRSRSTARRASISAANSTSTTRSISASGSATRHLRSRASTARRRSSRTARRWCSTATRPPAMPSSPAATMPARR